MKKVTHEAEHELKVVTIQLHPEDQRVMSVTLVVQAHIDGASHRMDLIWDSDPEKLETVQDLVDAIIDDVYRNK